MANGERKLFKKINATQAHEGNFFFPYVLFQAFSDL
jgi:hypothetical protein